MSSVPFHPAGHWSSYVAPSPSVPFTVVTGPLPPQVDPVADAAADPAVSPPTTSAAASAAPASFLVRTMNPRSCSTIPRTECNLPVTWVNREKTPQFDRIETGGRTMPRQNRVTPDGMLIAVPDRGLFWGNRGSLHDSGGQLVRYSRGKAWAICVLSFKGRRRELWAPGRLTELFFLDEATGLAAGHRPCGECRYRDYQAFKDAWAAAHGGERPGVQAIDARL